MNTPETLYVNSGLTETVVLVGANPTYLRSYAAFNSGATGAFLHFMDVASAASGAIGTIVATVYVPAGTGANLSGLQWRFANGLAVAASSSASALSAPTNSIVVTLGRG